MSDNFEIEEIAITQNLTISEFNGIEVVVISSMYRHASRSVHTGRFFKSEFGYDVRWPDGHETFQAFYELRKKRPPTDWIKLCKLADLKQSEPA